MAYNWIYSHQQVWVDWVIKQFCQIDIAFRCFLLFHLWLFLLPERRGGRINSAPWIAEWTTHSSSLRYPSISIYLLMACQARYDVTPKPIKNCFGLCYSRCNWQKEEHGTHPLSCSHEEEEHSSGLNGRVRARVIWYEGTAVKDFDWLDDRRRQVKQRLLPLPSLLVDNHLVMMA